MTTHQELADQARAIHDKLVKAKDEIDRAMAVRIAFDVAWSATPVFSARAIP